MGEETYDLPPFLRRRLTEDQYVKWLKRRADAHFRRDERRGYRNISRALYRELIHQAVCDGGKFDAYTGERLKWKLVGTYDNKKSQKGGSEYKRRFALLPTVDHVDGNRSRPRFRIGAHRHVLPHIFNRVATWLNSSEALAALDESSRKNAAETDGADITEIIGAS